MNEEDIEVCRHTCRVFCENVKKLRAAHKLSKKEMAEIAGVSVYALTQMEKLVLPYRTTVNMIINLRDYFHVMPDELFTEGMQF